MLLESLYVIFSMGSFKRKCELSVESSSSSSISSSSSSISSISSGGTGGDV